MEHLTYIHWFLTEDSEQIAEVEVLPDADPSTSLVEPVADENAEFGFEEDRDRLSQMYPTVYF